MAWSDLRGQSLSSINQLLGMRNQRKMQQAQTASDFGSQMMRQQHEAGEPGRQRAAEWDAFEDGPRVYKDPATGQEISYSSPGELALALSGQRGAQEAAGREDIQTFTDEQRQEAQKDALARLQEESRLNIEELGENTKAEITLMEEEMKNQQTMIDWQRAKYDNGYYQTQDGAIFRWSDPETYQAALDEINKHTQKLSTMSQRNPTVWEVYKDATDRAKEQMWQPAYDDQGMVIWERTEVDAETLLENFTEELDLTPMDEAQKAEAIEAFRTYLMNAENAPPQEFSEAGDSTSVNVNERDTIIPYSTPEVEGVATSGVAGPPTAVAFDTAKFLLGWIPGLNDTIDRASARLTDEVPEGITRAEYDVWTNLQNLGQQYNLSEEDERRGAAYAQGLLASGTSDRELITRVKDFIDRALSTSTRRGTELREPGRAPGTGL